MKRKQLKKFVIAFSVIALAIAGVKLQATVTNPNSYSLANLNALKSSSKDLECPSIYDVPYSSLHLEVKTFNNVMCHADGSITTDGFNFSGEFQKGGQYTIVVEIWNCKDEKEKLVCCKTSEQRAEILRIE